MNMNMYAVRDIHTGFNQPFCDVNDDSAERGFGYAMNNGDIMGSYPKDFDLYCVGTFDTTTGMITSTYPPILVCCGTEVVKHE